MRRLPKRYGVPITAALVLGVPAVVTYNSNVLPPIVLDGLPGDVLPPEMNIASNHATLICAAITKPCTDESALGAYALSSQAFTSLKDISPKVTTALIAHEDRRFLERTQGCDTQGIVRAGFLDTISLIKHKIFNEPLSLQGGSTIERQTASLIYKHPSDSELEHDDSASVRQLYKVSMPLARQAYECRQALSMRNVYTPGQIEEKYLNAVYFGRGAYGIAAAAKQYFHKKPADLNWTEAMILVATLPAPSDRDMDVNPSQFTNYIAAAKYVSEAEAMINGYNDVRNTVIDMLSGTTEQPPTGADLKDLAVVKKSRLDEELPDTKAYQDSVTKNIAAVQPYKPLPPAQNKFDVSDNINARYYDDFVLQQAATLLGTTTDKIKTSGFKIETCLNTLDQAALNSAVQASPVLQAGGNINVAGVSLAPDGCIKAMVGGGDYHKSQVNAAIAGNGPGSANKGFALAVDLEHGGDINAPYTIPESVSMPLGNGQPNWIVKTDQGCNEIPPYGSAPCKATKKQAIAVSSNTWAASMVKKYGINQVVSLMDACGMNTPKPATPALILGATAISPLREAAGHNCLVQNKGVNISYDGQPFYAISKITDARGIVVYQLPKAKRTRALSAAASKMTAVALRAVTQPGGTAYGYIRSPGGAASMAGKTGTNGSTDIWFNAIIKDANPALSSSISIWGGHNEGRRALPSQFFGHTIASIVSKYLNTPSRPHTNGPADIVK